MVCSHAALSDYSLKIIINVMLHLTFELDKPLWLHQLLPSLDPEAVNLKGVWDEVTLLKSRQTKTRQNQAKSKLIYGGRNERSKPGTGECELRRSVHKKTKQCWTARRRGGRVCVQCGGLNRVETRCVRLADSWGERFAGCPDWKCDPFSFRIPRCLFYICCSQTESASVFKIL